MKKTRKIVFLNNQYDTILFPSWSNDDYHFNSGMDTHTKSRVSGPSDLVPGSCHMLNPSPSLKWNSDSGVARFLSLVDFLEEKKARVVQP